MGVDTKGFVLTRDKDVMRVTGLVGNALNRLIMTECRSQFPSKRWLGSEEVRKAYQTVDFDLIPSSQMVRLNFTFRGVHRSISMFFACDCDQEEYGPSSISLSLSCFGDCEMLMRTVLHPLSLLGPVYFDANDCDDTDPACVHAFQEFSLLQAVALGYVKSFDVFDWVKVAETTGLVDSSPEAFVKFFGEPRKSYEALQKQVAKDYKAAWDEITRRAEKQPVVARDFISILPEPENVPA